MTSNIDLFKADLNKLCSRGYDLACALYIEFYGADDFINKHLQHDADRENFLKNLPDFKFDYQGWYSEVLILLKQILPDRVQNFSDLFEKQKNRKEVNNENYVIQDYLRGITISRGDTVIVDGKATMTCLKQQRAILEGAKARFKSSLFELRQLVQADLFDSELDAAKELQRNKYDRAAGIIAGVVLEKHLKQVCVDHKITLKKSPAINDYSEALKSASIISVAEWRYIGHLADLRNYCGHSKERDPKPDEISDLISGVGKIMKTVS